MASAVEARRDEFIRAAVASVAGSAEESRDASDATYVSLLPETVGAAYDYLVATIAAGNGHVGAVPLPFLAQARTAVVAGMSLERLIQRCAAVNSLLTVHLVGVAEDWPANSRTDLVRIQAAVFDKVIGAVGREHERAVAGNDSASAGARRLTFVTGLLAGDPLDPMELAYDLAQQHFAIVIRCEAADRVVSSLAHEIGATFLTVEPGDQTSWGWLGTHRPQAPSSVATAIRKVSPPRAMAGIGTCASGPVGWRLTHQQAKAAFLIGLRRGSIETYEDVAIDAALLRDRLLLAFLQQRYIAPIKQGPHGGAALLETLRVYFETGQNGESTAAAIGVSRQTVANRLRTVEERLGSSLRSCTTAVELAMRLDDLEEVFDRPTI